MGSTRKPTTSFSVVVLTNTSTTLINGVEKVLEKLGYTPSVIRVEVRGSKHIDRYGRLLVAKKRMHTEWFSIARTRYEGS